VNFYHIAASLTTEGYRSQMLSEIIHRVRVSLDQGWGVALIVVLCTVGILSANCLLSTNVGTVVALATMLVATIILATAWPRRLLQRLLFGATLAMLIITDLAFLAWQMDLLPHYQPDPAAEPKPYYLWFAHLVFVVTSSVLGVLLVTFRDRTAMGIHPRRLSRDFSDADFGRKVKNLVLQLQNDLDILDTATSWSATQFIPLDAEVEVYRGGQKSSTVSDLMKGLAHNRDRQLYIVLGDPGSGKSVALRKLARDLLREAKRTGRIPIYINLKEWRPQNTWTQEEPPSVEQIIAFILTSLRRRLGLTTIGADLIDTHFRQFLDAGRLFLIFDSFDEIPQLLDIKHAGWLINALSNSLTQLISGATDGRGIIASRLFRKPEISRSEFCRLDIKPLSDIKSEQLINQQPGSAADRRIVAKAIFSERPDLAAAGRNPLLLTLLIGYVHRNNGRLPPNQHELFRNHMNANIQRAIEGDYAHLNIDLIWGITEQIALTMFNERNYGLDMPLATLRQRLPDQPVEDIAVFLINSKLGRESQDRAFSFVHRRFNEFFLVRFLLHDIDRAIEQAHTIAEDGRWRDPLALYVEVAHDPEAIKLAEICMNEVTPLLNFQCHPSDLQYTRGMHCLRFLNDAFRGRSGLLADYVQALDDFVSSALLQDDLLIRKNAVETVGLLPTARADKLLALALSDGGDWVRETAFRACRYLPAVTGELLKQLRSYVLIMSASAILANFRRLSLLFSLSESLRGLQLMLCVRVCEAVFANILLIGLIFLSPKLLFLSCLFSGNFYLMAKITLIYTAAMEARRFPNSIRSFLFEKVTSRRENVIATISGSDGRLMSCFFIRAGYVFLLIFMFFVIVISALLGTDDRSYVLSENFLFRFIRVDTAHLWSSINTGLLAGDNDTFSLFFYGSILITMPYCGLLVLVYMMREEGPSYSETFWGVCGGLGFLVFILALFWGFGKVLRLVSPWIFWLLSWTMPAWPYLKEGMIWIPYLTLFLILLPFAIHAYRVLVDWRRIKAFRSDRPMTRRHIMCQFETLKSSRGRLIYVRWLWNQAADLEVEIRGSAWPARRRPNIGNDAASGLLAQLDERWLGLSR
jgi:hypothetical protein